MLKQHPTTSKQAALYCGARQLKVSTRLNIFRGAHVGGERRVVAPHCARRNPIAKHVLNCEVMLAAQAAAESRQLGNASMAIEVEAHIVLRLAKRGCEYRTFAMATPPVLQHRLV